MPGPGQGWVGLTQESRDWEGIRREIKLELSQTVSGAEFSVNLLELVPNAK